MISAIHPIAEDICQEQRVYDYAKLGLPLNKVAHFVELNYYPDKELLVSKRRKLQRFARRLPNFGKLVHLVSSLEAWLTLAAVALHNSIPLLLLLCLLMSGALLFFGVVPSNGSSMARPSQAIRAEPSHAVALS